MKNLQAIGNIISSTLRGITLLAAIIQLVLASSAFAQWTRVTETPVTEMFSVWANGDTVVAGAGTAVFTSTNGGATWLTSTKPVTGVHAIEASWVRNGRLYVGTFGQGVHVSDNLGLTWSPFNQGLVGGILNSQLSVVDFQLLGNTLYAATAGAGVYARNLSAQGTWQHFGEEFEPNQASNLNSLALGGTRLLAPGGANGAVFNRDPGDGDWTPSNLDNVGIHAGLGAMSAIWSGTGWVVGTNSGLFRSVAGQEPWIRLDPGLGPVNWTTFATQGHRIFAAFDIVNAALIRESDDDGATWHDEEVFPFAFIERLAVSGNTLFAARGDGLWSRTLATSSVPEDSRPRLSFAHLGPYPFQQEARLGFTLPVAGTASIGVFDPLGRLVGERIEGWWSAGPHEVSIDGRSLSSGVYFAQLTAGVAREAVRLVHVR